MDISTSKGTEKNVPEKIGRFKILGIPNAVAMGEWDTPTTYVHATKKSKQKTPGSHAI